MRRCFRKCFFAALTLGALFGFGLGVKFGLGLDREPSMQAVAVSRPNVSIDVYFSPNGGCEAAIVAELGKAKKEIVVIMYTLTSKPIAAALIDAKKRGVTVEVVIDADTEKKDGDLGLGAAGIPVWIDSVHAIMHDKFCVIDGQVVITGSYNWTNAAEHHNAENLEVIRHDPAVVKAFRENYDVHKGHSARLLTLEE